MKLTFRSGFLTIATLATLLFSTTWAASAADTQGSDCSGRVDRVADALSDGVTIAPAQMTKLQGCVLTQPGQTAAALAEAAAADAATPAVETATVLASFNFNQGIPFCLEFNSDGTINPKPLVPIVSAVGGGFLGVPGVFTLFTITIGTPTGFQPLYVGIGIGPFLLSVVAFPVPGPPPLGFGFQVPSC
jgi:hypothetical protein